VTVGGLPRSGPIFAWVCASLLVAAYAAQCIAFVAANGQTYDEGITLASGYRLLRDHRDDVNTEHPPLAKVIAALPVWLLESPRLDVEAWAARGESGFALGRDFLYDGGVPHRRLLTLGRAPMVALSIGLVVLVGLWAHRLWGVRAGLLALGLAAFDPNLVAHGSLIGHDAPLALFATCSFFGAGEFFKTRRILWLAATGAATGLAVVTKYSGLVVLAAVCVAFVTHALQSGQMPGWWVRPLGTTSRLRAGLGAAGNLVLLVGVSLVFVRVASGPSGYAGYIAGLRSQLVHQANGHPAYLLGEVSRSGWIGYFPVALAVKVPPLTLLLFGASLALAKKGAPLLSGIACGVAPLLVLFVTLLAVRADIGVRYALPLLPLLIVVAARAATVPTPGWLGIGFMLAVAHHVFACVRIAPHDLAFFSDVVGGPSRGNRYLADSNLDWGQDIQSLGMWLAEREPPLRMYLAYFGTALPEAYGVRYRPAPNSCLHAAPWGGPPGSSDRTSGRELFAVSVMNLQGVFFDDPSAYRWLETRRPIALLGYSIAVYDITEDSAAHTALAKLYERYGPATFAAEERARAAAIEGRPSTP
jgi:hypothetical protein